MPEGSTKAAMRDRFRDLRAKVSRAEHAAVSRVVVQHTLRTPAVQEATTVHCYWPLLDRGELDTRPLIRLLLDRGVRVVLPVVRHFTTTPQDEPRMVHRVLENTTALRANRWQVWEPTSGAEVLPDALDVIITPGLAADRRGYRLGFGMGYYDELLRASPATTVHLQYAAAIVPVLPSLAHDVPVDHIITEEGPLDLSPHAPGGPGECTDT